MVTFQTILYALAGGTIPALVWLWFWLREDRLHPEPRLLLLLAFLSGIIAVPFVLPFERMVYNYYGLGTTVFILWAAIEEVTKFAFAYITVLRRRAVDEPIDAVIYMITAALGFASIENTLFLMTPIMDGNFAAGLVTGDLRALGATLLHIVASATIGLFIAFSFYKTATLKKRYTFFGVILAIALHSIFNLLIMNSAGNGDTFYVFISVWIAVIVILALLEKVKTINRLT